MHTYTPERIILPSLWSVKQIDAPGTKLQGIIDP